MPAIKKLIRSHPQQLMQVMVPKAKDFFVAASQGKIIGCCALEVYSKRIAEIRSLVVDANFRKQGIATHLINLCLERAAKLKIREVLSITSAVKLFNKQGFSTFHREKFALLRVLRSK
ncbi:MAG: GNAT family N-acetyltransferase [Patescibacteria group bacterium]|nr:GNAT family N-acetyltransferase [Patescibacteria group bacterium]